MCAAKFQVFELGHRTLAMKLSKVIGSLRSVGVRAPTVTGHDHGKVDAEDRFMLFLPNEEGCLAYQAGTLERTKARNVAWGSCG